jgi:hypothetical protein
MSEVDIKKIIVDEFKAEGLEIAEDVAVRLTKVAFRAIPKVVIETENKADDYLLPLLALVEKPVMAALDKIDGQEG